MKLPIIKKIAESYTLDQLNLAEEELMEGNTLSIVIEGEDEGEQLTHVIAAKWVIEATQNGKGLNDALREYTKKVRESIS